MYARSLLVLIDGLGDDPIPAWDGLTPFERAEHPHMDRLAAQGKLEEVSVCGQDLVPGSLTCILRLLGVPKEKFPRTGLIWNCWPRDATFRNTKWSCAATSFPRTAPAGSFLSTVWG